MSCTWAMLLEAMLEASSLYETPSAKSFGKKNKISIEFSIENSLDFYKYFAWIFTWISFFAVAWKIDWNFQNTIWRLNISSAIDFFQSRMLWEI